MKKLLISVLLFTTLAGAQMPVPALPQVYINTTWYLPTGGTTWQPHTSTDLANALNSAIPGDTIVLDAGRVYSGNFVFPAKANPSNLWIYLESSALSKLPSPGMRIGPSNAVNMPKIVSLNSAPALTVASGANHLRLVGVEVTSQSTSPSGCPSRSSSGRLENCFTSALIYFDQLQHGAPISTDSIFIDRCYLHGSPTQDVGQGIIGNATNFAVIDSYISDIHYTVNDSQALLIFYTPGPIKIVDNYLSATTEDILFGGAGYYDNPYVPSDIEIRRNHFFKPLSWFSCGDGGTIQNGERLADGTLCSGTPNQWDTKNNIEFKTGQRVVVTGNILENTWLSGQDGTSVLFTVRTSQSGNIAVVDDITFQSNIIKNADAGFQTAAWDNLCSAQYGYPNCTSPGESKRVWVDDNLVLLGPTADGAHHWGASINQDLTDYHFQHNTFLMSDLSALDAPLYFELPQTTGCSPVGSVTHNVWINDNAMGSQVGGDCGLQGTPGLTQDMGDPSPMDPRFFGNVMFVPAGEKMYSWPADNYATMVPFTYGNPIQGNYQLSTPDWTDTTDGKVSGISWSSLQTALGNQSGGSKVIN